MYPGLTARPWHDPQHFPIAKALEKAAKQIAAEFRAVGTDQFRDEAEEIAREGRWRVLFLAKHGAKNDDIRALCPMTASVIDAHEEETRLAGVIYFSCLDPGTVVASHRGPANTRLRCHLGIEVPHDCGLRVGGIDGIWELGRCIVFDDSFFHEVWNQSGARRVVLIVDIWHPDLSREEVNLLQWMSSDLPMRS
jgi:aspartate beta-hydroxylase